MTNDDEIEILCPVCGKLFNSENQMLEHYDKEHLAANQLNDETYQREREIVPNTILVSDQMSDDEIKERIYEDMMNLSKNEAGTGWMRLETLLSGSSTDQILGAGLKALIDQNKIIIRQNELMLRVLSRNKTKSSTT